MTNRFLKQKNGQFIIIAVLFISTMIISIGAILYSTVTYYKYEPWEEYNTVIDGIQLNTLHLVELSLSDYSDGFNSSILKANLDEWKKDLSQIYPSYGISLDYNLLGDTGLDYIELDNSSSITANVTFSLNITSLGLTGYEFITAPSLNLSVIDVPSIIEESLNVTVTTQDGVPVFGLTEANFNIMEGAVSITDFADFYNETYTIIYSMKCDTVLPLPSPSTPIIVDVIDQRGIRVKVLKEG
ncbi:MAG: hypothetical protein FK734_01825 [Asgard group archaeon]|nr:hypothetical protein [Asgard group archaeon]